MHLVLALVLVTAMISATLTSTSDDVQAEVTSSCLSFHVPCVASQRIMKYPRRLVAETSGIAAYRGGHRR
jgi:hypothetical protein